MNELSTIFSNVNDNETITEIKPDYILKENDKNSEHNKKVLNDPDLISPELIKKDGKYVFNDPDTLEQEHIETVKRLVKEELKKYCEYDGRFIYSISYKAITLDLLKQKNLDISKVYIIRIIKVN